MEKQWRRTMKEPHEILETRCRFWGQKYLHVLSLEFSFELDQDTE